MTEEEENKEKKEPISFIRANDEKKLKSNFKLRKFSLTLYRQAKIISKRETFPKLKMFSIFMKMKKLSNSKYTD